MKNKKIVDKIKNVIIVGNKLDLKSLNSIFQTDILNLKQKKLLVSKIKREIRRIDVLIEHPSFISRESKNLILEILGNPNVYTFIENDDLLSGVNIKKEWEVYDLSILGMINKIKNG